MGQGQREKQDLGSQSLVGHWDISSSQEQGREPYAAEGSDLI